MLCCGCVYVYVCCLCVFARLFQLLLGRWKPAALKLFELGSRGTKIKNHLGKLLHTSKRPSVAVGLSTEKEGDGGNQQQSQGGLHRRGTVAVVLEAGANLLATAKSGALVALALVGGFIPSAATDQPGIWGQVVDGELDRLVDLPAEGVLVAVLQGVAVDLHFRRWRVVRALRIVGTVAHEAPDGVTSVHHERQQQDTGQDHRLQHSHIESSSGNPSSGR